jgi:hypothetical protein
MTNVQVACRCGHKAVGNRGEVVRQMQRHFASAHGRRVEAESILASASASAVVADAPHATAQPPGANRASYPVGEVPPADPARAPARLSELVLRRVVGALGSHTAHPVVASLAGLLHQQLEQGERPASPATHAGAAVPSSPDRGQAAGASRPTVTTSEGAPSNDAAARREAALSLAREVAEMQAAVQQQQRERSLGLQGMAAGINAMHQARMGIGH